MDMKFDLKGLDAALNNMRQLPKEIQKKGGRFALRKAAKRVLKAAQANAKRVDDPQSVSMISDNIALQFDNRHYRQTGQIKFRVGVLGGANVKQKKNSDNLPGGGTQHWRLIEFGTAQMPAQPMLRPALESNIDSVTAEFARELDKWLQRYSKRKAKVGR